MSTTSSLLARRLTRRAIDLLVVAFVILVGLSVGRQLIEWWRADPTASSPNLSSVNGTDLDWSRTPVTLEFGDASTSIERIPFQGGRKQIEDELAKIGQSIVNSSEPPRSAILEAERGWLDALKSAPPVMWDSARGNIYRRYEPLPSFVATRFIDHDEVQAAEIDDSVFQRVVGWGLAFPTSPVNWTIYVFHPDSAGPGENSDRNGVTLPEGSGNITHLTGTNGSQWQVFQGRGDLPSWVQHFDDQFGKKACTVRTIDSQSASLKYRREHYMTDVQIRRERDGRLTGVVWSANERETR